VVERICRDYALGKSAKTIAFALNKEGIPTPSGGDWGRRANIDAAQAEIGRIDREEEKLMDLYLKDALSIDAVKERGNKLRAWKAELTTFLAGADEPPPLLHPAMATGCVCSSSTRHFRLIPRSGGIEAAAVLRTLVEEIILTPGWQGRDRRSWRSC
jgi:hypothetical protein